MAFFFPWQSATFTITAKEVESRIMEKNIPTVRIPGSKSHSIRALLIACFARGTSRIENLLISSDTKSTMKAIEDLGCRLEYADDGNTLIVDSTDMGKGLEKASLDLGNSGTGTYLLLGLAASLGIPVTIYGDESLNSRPIGPLCDAYRKLGAKVADNDGKPPVTIQGPLKGGEVSIECRTSQYLSSLLMAGVLSKGEVRISCPILYEKPYVSITLKWLDEQKVDYSISKDLEHSSVMGNGKYRCLDTMIGGDFSSASFFFCLAAAKGISLRVLGLDRNDPQGDKRVLEVLEKMGCTTEWTEGGVIVTGPEELLGGTFDINDIPDALPILSAIAPLATEDVKLTNVPQARIKETDRIAVMRENLEALGADVEEESDGIVIHKGSVLHGAKVKGYDDHRVIMALSILGAVIPGIEIDSTDKAAVTFPSFFELLDTVRKEIEK